MKHVVTQKMAPFKVADGTWEVHQVPSWEDNLIWLIVCTETGEAAAVDGPQAGEVLDLCEARGWTLTTIFNTHTHPDHVGINRDLAKRGLLDAMTVIGCERTRDAIPGFTQGVDEGSEVSFGGVTGQVMLTEGHIDGHVSYLFEDVLFCGDTLFGAGCGYLFDGPPAKMYRSLSRLRDLDPDIRVCCAHEYTQDNLRFAWTVEPHNAALADRIRETWRVRATGASVIPSTIGLERATNPFLRFDSPEVQKRVSQALPERPIFDAPSCFAATRELKDTKAYRKLADTHLPL